MTGMVIQYSSHFERKFKDLALNLKKRVLRQISLLEKDIKSPSLKVHKLHGELRNYWSFRVTDSIRIIFKFTEQGILLLDLGSHDIYK